MPLRPWSAVMAAASSASFSASRRRLFGGLFASTGCRRAIELSRRCPGRVTAWLPRLSCAEPGCPDLPAGTGTLADTRDARLLAGRLAAFNALGSATTRRWAAWIAQQLDPAMTPTATATRASPRQVSARWLTLPQLWAGSSLPNNYFSAYVAGQRDRLRDGHPADLQQAPAARDPGRFLARPFQRIRLGLRRWVRSSRTNAFYPTRTRARQFPHDAGSGREVSSTLCSTSTCTPRRDGPNENYARELLELR